MQGRGGRATGLVVLCVVALAIAVLGRLQQPLRIDGAAAAEPPAAPPVVGDCMLDLLETLEWPAPDQVPPPLPLGSCGEPHFGEVFAVIDEEESAATGSACWTDEDGQPDPLAYLGYPPVAADGWLPTLSFVVMPAGPNDRQRAAGQQWVACVIAVSTYTTDRPFTASLADAYGSGTVPAQFGTCLDGADPMRSSGVSCDAVHGAQQFGWMQFDAPGPDRAALESTCRDLIADATGTDRLTDGDGLRSDVVVYRWPPESGSPVQAALPLRAGETALASCTLVATDGRELTASLLGLGDAPVPWRR